MAKTTVEFSEKAAEELGRLAGELETTKTEVLRDALSLYSFVVRELQKGHDTNLAIAEGNEVKKHIVVPGLRVPVW